MSGYLLTLPTLREPGHRLPGGPWRFMRRRGERLLRPYYAALAASIALFGAWCAVVGRHPSPLWFATAIVAHVFLVHDFHSSRRSR